MFSTRKDKERFLIFLIFSVLLLIGVIYWARNPSHMLDVIYGSGISEMDGTYYYKREEGWPRGISTSLDAYEIKEDQLVDEDRCSIYDLKIEYREDKLHGTVPFLSFSVQNWLPKTLGSDLFRIEGNYQGEWVHLFTFFYSVDEPCYPSYTVTYSKPLYTYKEFSKVMQDDADYVEIRPFPPGKYRIVADVEDMGFAVREFYIPHCGPGRQKRHLVQEGRSVLLIDKD